MRFLGITTVFLFFCNVQSQFESKGELTLRLYLDYARTALSYQEAQYMKIAEDEKDKLEQMLEILKTTSLENLTSAEDFVKYQDEVFYLLEDELEEFDETLDELFDNLANLQETMNITIVDIDDELNYFIHTYFPMECEDWNAINLDIRPSLQAAGSGHYYIYFSNQFDWYESRSDCLERGMELVTFKNVSEMQMIYGRFLSKYPNHKFWVSASDINRREGKFFWVDETIVLKGMYDTISISTPGFAREHDSEKCLALRNNTLIPLNCLTDAYFICEVDPIYKYCLST